MNGQRMLLLAIISLATWSPLSGQEVKLRATLQGHTKQVYSVAFRPDGWSLASASWDKSVRLWEAATGKERASLQGHGDLVRAVAFSPDGKTVASASWDQSVRLWEVNTGKLRTTFKGHTGQVLSVAFSPDGKLIASGAMGGVVKLWDVAGGKERSTLKGHTDSVVSVTFSPDGKTLATASHDMAVKLWEVATTKERARLQGHTGYIWMVAFGPDGKTLASASDDRTVKLWELASGKVRASLAGHTGSAWAVAFSPDGETLASGGTDNIVRLWDIRTGKERAALHGHNNPITSLSFSPDGKTLASASEDNDVKLWDTPVAKKTKKKTRLTQVPGQRATAGQQAKKTMDRVQTVQATRLSDQELNSLWIRLADEDARKAYQAMNDLLRAPQQAAGLLKQRLQPAPKLNVDDVRLIADLGSNRFAVRQQASERLEKAGDVVTGVLCKKLAEKPSLEVHRRIEELLARIDRSPETIRMLRAAEVLEHIGSSEAKLILEALAKGSEAARLTEVAKISLDRLNKLTAEEDAGKP